MDEKRKVGSKDEVCILCKDGRLSQLFNARDDYTGDSFPVLGCPKCGTAKTALPCEVELGKYYPDTYYGVAGKRFSGALEILVACFRSVRARFVAKIDRTERRSVVDIGCGRGLMLEQLKERNWWCIGVERHPDLLSGAREKGIDVCSLDILSVRAMTELRGQISVVTMWHSLEHLIDPVAVLHNAELMLIDKGVMVLEVPNVQSYQSRIAGKDWLYLEVPRHVFHFSARGLEAYLGSRTELRLLSRSTWSFEYGLIGIVTSLQNKFTSEKNLFFKLLYKESRHRLSNTRTWKLWRDIALTILSLPLVLLFGLLTELVAAAQGKGCVLRVVVQKNEQRSEENLTAEESARHEWPVM